MDASPLEQVAALLPWEVRQAVLALPAQARERAEEVRLRAGRPPGVVLPEGEILLEHTGATDPEELYTVLEVASRHSVHTVLERMEKGFVSVKGGHRIGICGEAMAEGGRMTGYRRLSSLNLRIAREVKGTARAAAPQLFEGGRLKNTLIVAPPGDGKTTFLRDLVRCLSDGDGVKPMRVGVADERGEVAALWDGLPQLDVGRCTDVIDGAPKAEGLLLLLRGMNPQVLAADEITCPEDVEAVLQAAGCGVSLLATAHGSSVKEMTLRPIYRRLFSEGVFRRVVTIARCGADGTRQARVEVLP